MARPTRSARPAAELSPEVKWYLRERGYKLPRWCLPAVRTPEPRDVPGAVFDPARVDRVIAALRMLRHVQGRWAGRPLDPDAWQVAYVIAPVFGWVAPDPESGELVRIVRNCFVDVPRKNGKGVHTAEVILTRHGWKPFGDLQVGDEVHAVDGTLVPVTYTSPVRELDCYRVTFGDGQSVVCDADHLWTVWDRYGHDPSRWAAARGKGAWRTIATPDLAETHRSGARGDNRYSVRTDRVIDRPTADLPVDPYLLGVWLGDGHTDAARVTSVDASIPAAFSAAGYGVRQLPGTITHSVTGGFLTALRALDVIGHKRVPESYLLAAADQRLALLQGLMDTDGSVIAGPNTPRVEFTSTNRELAAAALFLARSLGARATCLEGRAQLNGKDCGPRWRVSWTAFAEDRPFRLARKLNRLHGAPARRTRSNTNAIVDVQRVPTVPTMCIQVDHPSHQFLVGRGLVPTHNTTLATGLAMVLAFADGEPGAQVVAAAASKDQARNAFDPARTITEGSPQLRKAGVKALAARIERRMDGSFFKVVSALADLIHGANIHGAVVDELHVHKDDQVLKAIESGTGARLQPLVVIITTTDEGKPNTVYDQTRKYIERLAQRTVANPRQYGVIFAAREGDPPASEATWRRANPGYGVSPTKAFLEDEARKAQQNPSNMAAFERLHLGLRSRRRVQYMPLPLWDRNAGMVREEKLVGRPCYIGLDLSATTDITAACLLFVPDEPGGGWDAVWRFWTPEANLPELAKRTAGAADQWVKQGLLRLTPGNVVDYDRVEHQLDADLDRFDVVEVAYDPWNATDLTNRLTGKGAPMVEVRQGYKSMSPPLKELLRLLTAGTEKAPQLRHGGNPAMRWMVDNLAVARDAADNVKPDKASSAEKIDGVSALVTAMARAMHHQDEPARGVLQIF